MATKSSGEGSAVILVWGKPVKNLRVAAAFGGSMRPFIKPGAELHTEPVIISAIQVGDIISFEPRTGHSTTHRVVKIFKQANSIFILTKGDSRRDCDTAISESQILGRVTHVDGNTVRSLAWRVLGHGIARISYGQALFYRFFAESCLNLLRRRLEKAGQIPKVPVHRWLNLFFNPLTWCAGVAAIRGRCQIFLLRRRLYVAGFRIERSLIPDPGPMVRIWNLSFPDFLTTNARFQQRVCAGPYFESSLFFLVMRNEKLKGWALVRMPRHDQASKNQESFRTGHISIVALEKEAWQSCADRVLFHDVLMELKKRKAQQIFLSPHPVSSIQGGIQLTSPLITAAQFGLNPSELSMEWTAACNKQCFQKGLKLHEDVEIRLWRPEDDAAVRSFLDRNGMAKSKHMYDPKSAGSKRGAGIFIASLHQGVIGFCRWILDDAISDCSEVTWMWATAQPKQRRGYIMRLFVEEAYRRQGLGARLVAKTAEIFFQSGCHEMSLIAVDGETQERFYGRLGFRKTGYFLKAGWSAND